MAVTLRSRRSNATNAERALRQASLADHATNAERALRQASLADHATGLRHGRG